MNGSASNTRLRLKPLSACLALALCVSTSTTALAAAQPAHAAPGAGFAARHTVQRTGAGFLRMQQERLERGWLQARAVAKRPATTLPVTSCADDGSGGTLREVVAGAVDGDTVDLSALTCSTISLAQGGIAINVDNLSMVGPGADKLTIDGGGMDTVLNFYGGSGGGGTLQISGLTVANGFYEDFGGGGIWTGQGGSVELTNSVVTNSTSTGMYASGGGIFAAGNVTLVNSTVSNNTASSSKYDGIGGGVYAKGDLTVVNSTISGNTAKADGSYVGYYGYTYDGYGLGGGAAAVGTTRISNSTISGNAAAIGGGVFAMSLESLQNSTVTLNQALPENSSVGFGEGGGIAVNGNAGPGTLDSNILFGNSGGGGYYGADLGGLTTVVGSNNLIGSSTSPVPADTLSADPLLLPLANNGGPTMTHALGAASPAIDSGSNPGNLTTDQRGGAFARVSGSAADIGAFEVQQVDAIFVDGFEQR
jgi:hypothetical protein